MRQQRRIFRQQRRIFRTGIAITPPQCHIPSKCVVVVVQFYKQCHHTLIIATSRTHPLGVRKRNHTPWYHTPFVAPASCTLSPGLHTITPPPGGIPPVDNYFKTQNVITGMLFLYVVYGKRRGDQTTYATLHWNRRGAGITLFAFCVHGSETSTYLEIDHVLFVTLHIAAVPLRQEHLYGTMFTSGQVLVERHGAETEALVEGLRLQWSYGFPFTPKVIYTAQVGWHCARTFVAFFIPQLL